jgi:hypothetical protein
VEQVGSFTVIRSNLEVLKKWEGIGGRKEDEGRKLKKAVDEKKKEE